jgi:radical SAM enzyme (TIGR01210 family)
MPERTERSPPTESLRWTDAEILAARGPKNRVDPLVPWALLVEPERSAAGEVVDVATIFLTNRECPFRCLMCDLWKNTTDEPVPPGAIPEQIDHALARLPPARQVKLYNSGNFFDPRAIPREDYVEIASRVRPFENVIVENHPRLCSDECLRFRDLVGTNLEIALGLETIEPRVLAMLNKRMTADDFDQAAEFLRSAGIDVRAFILLKPPPMTEDEGVQWALASIEHAFAAGAGCCSIIPTRAGNGSMEALGARGQFAPPRLESLEEVLEAGIGLRQGRVFVDLWDAERLATCDLCGPARLERLRQMNLCQEVLPPVVCPCGAAA